MRPADLAALTSARFVAAFLILMSHGVGTFSFIPKLTVYSFAVPFFFVLSGFILMHRYGDGNLNVGKFFRARVARLWPAHLVWTILAILLLGLPLDFPRLVLNLTMLHAWSPYRVDFYSYNSVSWSISTEMALYAAFPFLARNFLQNWPTKLAVCIIIYLMTYLYALNYPSSKDYHSIQFGSWLYAFPPARLHAFCFGMVALVLWQRWSREWLGRAPAFAYEILGVAALLLAFHFATLGVVSQQAAWLVPIVIYAAFAMALIPLAQGAGPIARILAWRPLVYLGEISFSVYLSHQVILNVLTIGARDEPSHWWGRLSDPVKFVVYVAIVLLASMLTHRVVEMPLRKLIVGWRPTLNVGERPRSG